MQRREVLTALFAGLGASIASSHALALSHFAPLSAPLKSTAGIATEEDMNAARIEKTFGGGYWRHRRRRARRRGGE
ncbi:MAG: hypothetical protein FJX16_11260 [Alphaproteobacteria bacterium]|nr:hypothetical protein [Alphaproteobacteria bacterium]MBM3625874.1 hypothetical protein [Alphaproteobacteria bacterium]MBM3653421.1 hypothetical protein [Alphaproteobacteria bacterium]